VAKTNARKGDVTLSISINLFKKLFPKQAAEMDLTPVNLLSKGSKYGAVISESGDGHKFDSKREHKYYEDLLLLKNAGIVKEIILQPEFELQESYVKDGKKVKAIKYIADFKVIYSDGTEEIIDVKGFKNKVYELKKKLFHYKYPNLTIKEVR